MNSPATLASISNKKIPWEVNTILSIGLENEVADRYRNMESLRRDLEHYFKNEPLEYKKTSLLRRTQLVYKRNQKIVNIVAVSGILISISTAWSLYNLRVERDRAVKERDQSIALVQYMNSDLQEKLQLIGRLDLMGDVQQRVNKYFSSENLDSNDLGAQRQKAIGIAQYAETLQQQGKIKQAEKFHLQALLIIKDLVGRNPENTLWQYDLSISFAQISTLYQQQGKLDKALELHLKSLSISRALLNKNPNNAQWQNTLSSSLYNIGDLYQQIGQYKKALVSFQKSLSIAKKLVELDPASARLQRNLSISYEKIARIYRFKNDVSNALESYQTAIEIQKILVHDNPNNALLQHDLFISYSNLSEMLSQIGKGEIKSDKVLNIQLKAHRIIQALSRLDSSNVQWERDLSMSYRQLGDIYQVMGEPDKALESYQTFIKTIGVLEQKNTLSSTDNKMIEKVKKFIKAFTENSNDKNLHYHGSRKHKHPLLEKEGLKHRHNNGLSGNKVKLK